ncbi:hypothetical protein ONS95_012087 [Cadophora gregata]|uniref:uncharacterized protein n=1 Tax=Cadophora gregata TaxID=51156 RepID=UPI0026DC2D83|nr:uncharacterized protein ONS95_012087 [Cadophora gregata]KAK0117761.1 hypothetical protein ONS95_012087 [Cadophora gregata]KAK0122811.1 hypothetical protein ONS96_009844 [Cadophora gregata f. sp. sojae]
MSQVPCYYGRSKSDPLSIFPAARCDESADLGGDGGRGVVVVGGNDITSLMKVCYQPRRLGSDTVSSFTNLIRKHNTCKSNAMDGKQCDAYQREIRYLHLFCICLPRQASSTHPTRRKRNPDRQKVNLSSDGIWVEPPDSCPVCVSIFVYRMLRSSSRVFQFTLSLAQHFQFSKLQHTRHANLSFLPFKFDKRKDNDDIHSRHEHSTTTFSILPPLHRILPPEPENQAGGCHPRVANLSCQPSAEHNGYIS